MDAESSFSSGALLRPWPRIGLGGCFGNGSSASDDGWRGLTTAKTSSSSLHAQQVVALSVGGKSKED